MKILETLKNVACSIDMFYSSEMLRYENKKEYKTITGGLVTISIVVMVIVGFANMISDTLNRTAITSSLNNEKSNNPPFYNLIANAENNFMFGINIQPMDVSFYVDLATGPRYFDIVMNIAKF